MYNKDSVVANSLIDMYAKCGRIDDSRLAFDKMDKRDEVSWNAIICGGSKFIWRLAFYTWPGYGGSKFIWHDATDYSYH